MSLADPVTDKFLEIMDGSSVVAVTGSWLLHTYCAATRRNIHSINIEAAIEGTQFSTIFVVAFLVLLNGVFSGVWKCWRRLKATLRSSPLRRIALFSGIESFLKHLNCLIFRLITFMRLTVSRLISWLAFSISLYIDKRQLVITAPSLTTNEIELSPPCRLSCL